MDNVHFIRSNKETERYFFLVMASKDLIENAGKYGYRIRRSEKISEVKSILELISQEQISPDKDTYQQIVL